MATRFVQEAQTPASLKHANMVPVFAGKPQDDAPYFAMEYLPRSLASADERQKFQKAGPASVAKFVQRSPPRSTTPIGVACCIAI